MKRFTLGQQWYVENAYFVSAMVCMKIFIYFHVLVFKTKIDHTRPSATASEFHVGIERLSELTMYGHD